VKRNSRKNIMAELIGTLHYSKLIVAIAFAELTLYAIAALVIFCQTGAEPVMLTQCFYTVIGAEFGLTALVTIAKTISQVASGKSSDSDISSQISQIYIDAAQRRAE
jgi:hypothetical protein